MSIRSVAFYNSRTLGFNIPACDEPPDPDPGPDLNHDDTNNNDDSHVINNEDEDINERNCETLGWLEKAKNHGIMPSFWYFCPG